MKLEKLIDKTLDQSYKIGQLKGLLDTVIETVDEKHISPRLRNRIIEVIN